MAISQLNVENSLKVKGADLNTATVNIKKIKSMGSDLIDFGF